MAPDIGLDLIDHDSVALLAAKENVPTGQAILASSLSAVAGLRDAIFSNPPLHAGHGREHTPPRRSSLSRHPRSCGAAASCSWCAAPPAGRRPAGAAPRPGQDLGRQRTLSRLERASPLADAAPRPTSKAKFAPGTQRTLPCPLLVLAARHAGDGAGLGPRPSSSFGPGSALRGAASTSAGRPRSPPHRRRLRPLRRHPCLWAWARRGCTRRRACARRPRPRPARAPCRRARSLPNSSSSASGFLMCSWITRASGRAPNFSS